MSDYEYWDLSTGEGLTEYELYERYDEMLNEVYGDASIGGMEYETSSALEQVDPIAYRCGFNDWVDSELGETITEDAPVDVDKLATQAHDLGRERGASAGSWVIDGNTSEAEVRAIVKGYEDGDPQVMDMQPSPLSGEWADDPTIGEVLAELGVSEDDDVADDLLEAYEAGFGEGFWAEVLRSAEAIA